MARGEGIGSGALELAGLKAQRDGGLLSQFSSSCVLEGPELARITLLAYSQRGLWS